MNDIILRHEIQETENGCVLVIHLNHVFTEFSTEFFAKSVGNNTSLKKIISKYISEQIPNKKIITVKLVMGSLLFAYYPYQKVEAHDIEVNMSYLYFGSSSSFSYQVERAGGNLNTISPSYFDLNSDGSLRLTHQIDTNFIKEMHSKGIKVTPFLSNHWDRELGRVALGNSELLSTQIANAIEKYNLDGINVDIENVTDLDREEYTNFVRLLSEKIPKDKVVSVAVAANPNGWTKGWHGSYDYNKLAQYSDYLVIMAYDESYTGGPEGPVASLPWVEKSIQYAIRQGVENNKIILGIPFYGRYWISGQTFGGYGVSQSKVSEMLNLYDGKVIYDENYQSPMAIIDIDDNDVKQTFGGKVLGPGTYHIWYENNKSIEAKVNLVHKYNLGGTGSWSLGQENIEIWKEYGSWVRGHSENPFSQIIDVQNHWAKYDIKMVYEQGWMKGKTPAIFSPNDSITRAEAAVILVRALQLKPLTKISSSTVDVPSDYWAKTEIEIIKQHNLMVGDEKGKFNANDFVSREQLAAIIHRAIKGNEQMEISTSPFKDVLTSRWSYQDILAMHNLGIFSGFNDGTFRPSEPITRAQMAVILNRVSNKLMLTNSK
ncbi:glycosyl hydrolase family 18 protein [Bacillus pinisoli]|uniref:glycosyl hydrolase family 18 protein n=1 Tax=Bacillus pinisoli TaxID=2901866 RepID=UPI001FF35A52|nr:glycosyl hydrolase family 18 protein [Bacillus pinisoli]